jgi:uncharacterized protein with ATP-grasp and redox domains
VRLDRLAAEIPDGAILPLDDPEAPDLQLWASYIQPYLGQGWLEVPWFLAETYFFRRVLEASGYFRPERGQGIDPFAAQKRRAFDSARPAMQRLAQAMQSLPIEQGPKPAWLAQAFRLAVWANQADLSMWPEGEAGRPAQHDERGQREHLLVDHSEQAAHYLARRYGSPTQLVFVQDNVGLELVADLFLLDALIRSGLATTILLHLKPHPTFVSDTTRADLDATLDFLADEPDAILRQLGLHIRRHLASGSMQLRQDFFFTSPLPLWEMPPAFRKELEEADFAISIGDANYRRSLGDRQWPSTQPIQEIWRYLPCPWLALRVVKAEIIAGLAPGVAEALDIQDANWMKNGRWGVIQFSQTV